MARYDHLKLLRLPERLPRRKNGSGGPPPQRNPRGHSDRLGQELGQAVAAQRQRRRPDVVDPSLILRVQMSGPLLEEEWNRVGLTVLSSDEDRTLVLFSSNDELTKFQQKLDAYGRGVQPGRQNPAFASFIANVETIAEVTPRDRIGMRAREAGLVDVDDFQIGKAYTVDIELWDLGTRALRERKIDDIIRYAEVRALRNSTVILVPISRSSGFSVMAQLRAPFCQLRKSPRSICLPNRICSQRNTSTMRWAICRVWRISMRMRRSSGSSTAGSMTIL